MSHKGQTSLKAMYRPEGLIDFCTAIFAGEGLTDADARLVADSLVHANLRGVDSHGVTRVPIYVKRLQKDVVEKEPNIQVLSEARSTVLLDGGNGMGAVVATRAMSEGLRKMRESGSASVAVRNNNHVGAGAYFAAKATAEGAIVFIYSNAPPTMAPWHARTPYFGTNPYCFSVPARKHPNIVLDMATSVVARGKIIVAAERGEAIPPGWAIDEEGRETTDAQAALDGCVLPFGGPKGSGIALMIDILGGVLSGAGFGRGIGDLYRELSVPQNVGSFIQLINIARFMPMERFLDRIDTMIDEIKALTPVPGVNEVMLPGELEARTEAIRSTDGIPLPEDVESMLMEYGKDTGFSLSECRV